MKLNRQMLYRGHIEIILQGRLSHFKKYLAMLVLCFKGEMLNDRHMKYSQEVPKSQLVDAGITGFSLH